MIERRHFILATAAALFGMSAFLLFASGLCARSGRHHLTIPGVPACHGHEPLSHLSLLDQVSRSVPPAGAVGLLLVLLLVIVRAVGLLHLPKPSGLPAIFEDSRAGRPPPFVVQAMADGILGGHVAFG